MTMDSDGTPASLCVDAVAGDTANCGVSAAYTPTGPPHAAIPFTMTTTCTARDWVLEYASCTADPGACDDGLGCAAAVTIDETEDRCLLTTDCPSTDSSVVLSADTWRLPASPSYCTGTRFVEEASCAGHPGRCSVADDLACATGMKIQTPAT